MENILDKYGKQLVKEELSDGTINTYMRIAKSFVESVGKKETVTMQDMLNYKKKLKERGLAAATINLYVVAVNRYMQLVDGDCVLKAERVQKKRSLENVLTRDEYKKMLRHAAESGREKYYCLMRTLALTGIRISELRYFTVEVLGKKKIMVFNKGKEREVYLPDKVSEMLKTYCGKEGIASGVIFRGKKGSSAVSRVGVYKMLVRIAEEAEIDRKKAHPHSFRHLFALTYMKQYKNLPELADILGHSNLDTTRIYTVSSVEEKVERMNRIDL